MEGGKELPRNFLEVLGNNLEFGEVGGVFSIGAGAAAEKDVVNVGGKAREGGGDSGSLSVQGYTIVGAHPLDLLLHLGHPLLVHFLTQVKNGSSDVDQGEKMVAPLLLSVDVLVHLFVQIYGSNEGQHGVPRNLLPDCPNFRGDSANSGNVIAEPFGAVIHGFLFLTPVQFFVGGEPEHCRGEVGLALDDGSITFEIKLHVVASIFVKCEKIDSRMFLD